MKKTYPALEWSEVKDKLGMAHELGMLGEAVLRPVNIDGQSQPDWDLSVIFTGFDFEVNLPGEAIVEKSVKFSPSSASVVSDTDPEVIEEWARVGEERIRGRDAAEALVRDAEMLTERSQGQESNVVAASLPEPEPVEPVTTKPAPPAEEPGEQIKTCVRCEEKKPLSAFHKHKAFADGRDNRCAECRAEMRREKRGAAPETKVCVKCGEKKPLSEYGKNVRSKDGKSHTCSECLSAAARIGAAARNSRRREDRAESIGPETQAKETRTSEAEPTKLCTKCGPEAGPKPLSAFAESNDLKNNPDGHVKVCRDCRSELSKRANSKGGNAQLKEHAQREMERIKQEAERIGQEEEPAPQPGPSFAGGVVDSLKKAMKITVLPRAERVPEPHEIAAQPREAREKVERFCVNGEECVSYEQLDGSPAKLAERNIDGRCFACQEADVGSPGSPKVIVRHAADGTTR